MTKALEARRSIRAPICDLPRDILIEIFYFVCQSWWRGTDSAWQIDTCDARERRSSLHAEGPLCVLGRVCKFWRETLHTSSTSWAQHMVITMPSPKHVLETLRTYLGRTGGHPLTLLLTNGDSELPPGEEDDILKFLVESCHRWKDVIIETSPYHLRRLEASISHLPTLQTIQIRIHNVYNDDFRSNICLMAPKLRQAKLSNQRISQVKIPPYITHYSGSIARPDDIGFLEQLQAQSLSPSPITISCHGSATNADTSDHAA